jgi:hypothetical protein
VRGAHAQLTLARKGPNGERAVRVAFTAHGSTYSFAAAGTSRAASAGATYRIGAWLRSDVPGLSVCLRIQEVSPNDALTPVRTTETCIAPTAEWHHFWIVRRALARGDKLVFSIYSFGALSGDRFEIDGFTVLRRTAKGWKRVDEAFAASPEIRQN